MEQKLSRLNRYFEEQIALCGRRNRELLADGRMDEAAFERVKANVYDIFRTVLSVAVQTGKEDPDAVRRFFVQKAAQIPSGWAAAYEKPGSTAMRSGCKLNKSNSTQSAKSGNASQQFGRKQNDRD